MRPEDYSFLKIEVRDGIGFVTFNRPEQQNQYTRDGIAEFLRLPRDVDEADDIRAVVLTGAGEAFSAGMDPEAAQASVGRDPIGDYELSRKFMRAYVELDKPLIVALNGVVVGMPLTMVLVADIIVAERQVRLRDIHTPYGIVSATGPLLLPLSIGLLKAKRYVLTGEWIDAEEAERLGLFSEVVDTGRSLERATEYAKTLAELRPETLRFTKRALNSYLRRGLMDVFDEALAVEMLAWPESYRGGGAEDEKQV